MPLTTDHLSREQLCQLLETAFSMLTAAKRRSFLEKMPAPPLPPPPTAGAFERVIEVVDGLIDFLDEDPAGAATWINGSDWDRDTEFEEELEAWQEDLQEALKEAVRYLATQRPNDMLSGQLKELMEAIDLLCTWECEYATGVTYSEIGDGIPGLEPLRIWSYLLQNSKTNVIDLASELVKKWPRPREASLLVAALGAKRAHAVAGALGVLADQGNAGAARWLVQDPPGNPALLARYAALAPDLGNQWCAQLAARQDWKTLVEAPKRNIQVPPALLYQAAVQLQDDDLAFRTTLAHGSGFPLAPVWDNAVLAGKLDLFRQQAKQSSRAEARWIGLEEAALLQLPSDYDHDIIKRVVSYAIARLSKGKITSEAKSYELSVELLARLATAPGPHDPASCLKTALDGLESMIRFHIAGKSRSRYNRAAAYWAQHSHLCQEWKLPNRAMQLRGSLAEELRRLPALRKELIEAKVAWK